MAKGDLKIVDLGGRVNPVVRSFFVPSGKGAIKSGEPVRIAHEAAAGVGLYVVPLEDNRPLTTNTYFLGIAASDASHTSSANGRVDVYLDLDGQVYGAAPKTADAANSRVKIDSYMFYRIVIDLTSSKYTADLASDDQTRGFVVVGGDPDNDQVHFVCVSDVSWRGRTRNV